MTATFRPRVNVGSWVTGDGQESPGPRLSPGTTPGDPLDPANLESESVTMLCEVAATFERPILLFSEGKASAVLLHLATEALWPAVCGSRSLALRPQAR